MCTKCWKLETRWMNGTCRVKTGKSMPTGDEDIKQMDLHLRAQKPHRLDMQSPLMAGT